MKYGKQQFRQHFVDIIEDNKKGIGQKQLVGEIIQREKTDENWKL